MRYVCLVYHEQQKLEALSDGELDAMVGECAAWVEHLEAGGHHEFSAGLQTLRTAATLRDRGGSVSVTDGPFAETKEFLGGFTVINAADLNEAIRLASKLPAARLGSVEVRPVLEPGADMTCALDRKIGDAMRRKTHRPDRGSDAAVEVNR